MPSVPIRRLLIAAAALTVTAALVPVIGRAPAAEAAARTPTTTAATAAAAGRSFDPAGAYVPGSPLPLTAATAPSVPTDKATPSASTEADANGGSLDMSVSGSVETPQGAALTSTLPGGDSLQLYSQGVVTRTSPDGSTVWQRSTASLYKDWKLTFLTGGDTSLVGTPQIPVGTDPAYPFELTLDTPYAMKNTQPYAVGDLTGDGTADIAVAETVGVNLGAASCGNCGWPFSVPGSDLQWGTFVSVLDGKTGAMVYHELDPGFVTQLTIAGKKLVVGDETGSPTSGADGFGQWGSVSTIKALTLKSSKGKLTASTAWTFSTGASWALLLGLQPIDGGVAVSWSDTPVGLGVPGPADGHVVFVDKTGKVRWDQRTAGYPVLSAYDVTSGLLAVAELTDPTVDVSYTLAGLRPADGKVATSTRVTGVLPTVLTIGALTTQAKPSWLVAGVVTTPDQVEPPYYDYTASTITAFAATTSKVQWKRTLAPGADHPVQPGSVTVVPAASGAATVVVGSWEGAVTPTAQSPITEVNDLQAFSGTAGAPVWAKSGDVPDALSLAASGTTIRGITGEQTALSYTGTTGKTVRTAPLLSDFNAAAGTDVNGDGKTDDVAGTQGGAVYAFNGRTLTVGDDHPDTLWRAVVGGPVHQIVPGTLTNGRKVLAVAATTEIDVIDQKTGAVLSRAALPGQYVWNVAIGAAGGRTVVSTASDRLSGFDASTGKALWTYRPSVASYFGNVSMVDGVVVSEYQNQVGVHEAPATMAALGIDAATGRTLWSSVPDPATTYAAQLVNSVIAGAGIAGAGADGAAFSWQTQDGDGRIDVRNARTGALDYSNTDIDLVNHNDFALDPAVGLVAMGDFGSALITPAGPQDSVVYGSGAAITRSGGKPVLVTGRIGAYAYPTSIFSSASDEVDPLATQNQYLTGRVTTAADGSVLATPLEWRQHQVLSSEAGLTVRPYLASIQRGLAVLKLTGTPATAAAKNKVANGPVKPVTKPGTLALDDPARQTPRLGTIEPSAVLKVHGYSSTGVPQLVEPAPVAYTPATMRSYLHLTGTGAGQTVAVVDAYGNPNIQADVDAFSTQFGLPPVKLTIKAPDGVGDVDANWGIETSMDVEWIHAVAPDAAITLVEAKEGTFSSLFSAVDAAAALKPAAVSMSWGLPEEFTDETWYDNRCKLTTSICSVSTGDYGYPGSYPAYNPNVLAVGGTTLTIGTDGSVLDEQAWAGSGGGQSWVEPTPAYQKGVVSGSGRGIPDVSFDADPETGVAVLDTTPVNGQTGWFQVGGTSLGAPAWAAIVASTDQLRAAKGKAKLTAADSSALKAIYGSASKLGDVTEGANGFCPANCTAGKGYDFVTGLGSPRAGIDATLAETK